MRKKLGWYAAFMLILTFLLSMAPQASAAGTKLSGVTLLNLASPYNYTLQLPSQVYVKYVPAGTSTAKTAGLQNIAWHYYSYNGDTDKDRPIYCIEPLRDYNAGSPGNYMDQGVDVWGSNSTGSIGSNAWYALSSSQRSAIAYILQYSEMRWDDSYSVTTTAKANNPNFGLRNATQVLIYEIVTGLRNPSTFVRNDSNGYTDGSVLYDAFKDQISDFRSHYNGLVSDVQGAMLLPSFCSASSSSAPTITLATDSVLTWVQDSNGVLESFTFEGDDDIYFNVYNELCIEHYGNLSGTRLYSCYKSVPSTSSSSFNVFYGTSSSYQTCVALNTSGTSTLTGYFKLYAAPQTGNLSIKKTTSDGKNLSGWQFSLYSNSACTSLISGPHTTNSSGAITVSNLTAGQTVYVKEVGHQTSSVNSQYSCSSTNPQKVTITAGGTTSVSFVNTLKPGSLSIKKTTSDGQNLSGWQFSLYSNSACTSLISGPHTTNSNGAITVSNLTAGQTVYVKEVGHQDSSINALYTCASTNPQSVTITAGGTASVSFSNTLVSGDIKIVKETNTGENRNGWRIGIFTDAACTTPITGSPFVTGTDGTIVASVTPGTYYAKEESRNDSYWQCDSSVKSVTVTAGDTASVTFRNTHLGRIEFQKTTNTGEHLSGWTFRVIDADGNTVGDFTTDSGGKAQTGLISPGKYKVQELSSEDDYWQVELGLHDVTVKAGETVIDKWHNVEQGLGWFHKETNTGENTSSWEITIYSDETCTTPIRTVTTLEEGKIGVYMSPGIYWAKETGDDLGRFESSYWQIDTSVQEFEIKPHEDTAITFRNIHCGDIQILKTMEPEGPLDGWVFKVTDSTGKEIEGSPFTTTETGALECGLLQPGTYTVEELIPEDSLYQCTSANPQTVTVKAGETSKVSFVNAIRYGSISIHKVDGKNESLAGAGFLLEWRKGDGPWQPIRFDNGSPEPGTTSNSDVADGCLTSSDDGMILWDDLYPGLEYRVTEITAPEGYELLKDYAFVGELPADDLTVTMRVVNHHGFTLPDTGSNGRLVFQFLGIAAISILILLPVLGRKRKAV